MTWEELLTQQRVAQEPSSKEELAELRSAAEQALRDASVPGLSAAGCFQMAYNAARLHAVRAIRASGFRVKQRGGGHYNTFLALEAALGPTSSDLVSYLDSCREKRNLISYDVGHAVTATEAHELLREAAKLRDLIDAWLRMEHPTLL